MAAALGYEVLVCDPRDEYTTGFAAEQARLVPGMPDDVVRDLRPDGHTAIVALTHDPKLDDLALMEALGSAAFYIGAIGSRANQAKRKQRLSEHFGLTDEALNRLHGPVGLKNGARTPRRSPSASWPRSPRCATATGCRSRWRWGRRRR